MSEPHLRTMSFIVNLTRREIRSSWRRLLFFFLCIALGVGSVVALRSLIQNLKQAVGVDARALLTADIEVSSTNDFTPFDIEKIESVVKDSRIVEARNEAITTALMARPAEATNQTVDFVELKGIEPPFPLVGAFTLSDGKPFDFALLQSNGAVVARVLLEQLNIKIGDRIKIGEGEFQVRAIFDEEPGGSSGFRLGPRVFIEKRAFDDAGITRNSSRVRRRILYRTSTDPTELVGELRESVKGTTLNVASYREQQENLSEQFVRTENFLALTGLLILVLGGVGVWNVARAFIEQKRKTVAVLKCLGAGGNTVISVYLLQIVFLGLVGSSFGALLAQAVLWLAEWRFGAELPARMTYAVNVSTVWQGMALGLAISILFSLLPLLQIRQIKPRLLLRDENNTAVDRLDRSKWAIGAFSVAALLGLSVWQAGSLKVGAYFLGGLFATSLVLYLAATLLTRLLRRIRVLSSFTIKQAINSLYRPGNQTRIVLLAVGLGSFVVLTVQIMQANLISEFDVTRNGRLPSLLFVDVQKSQINDVVSIITERLGEEPLSIPTVRGRIAFINGQPFDYQQREVRQQQGIIGREFALTYRPNLDENETVVSGTWWNGVSSPDLPQVSIEEGMANTLKVGPGDSISFNVSGRTLTARIANVRKIDLRNTRTAFVFVFQPGLLENAPQTFAATVLKHAPATERQRLQREIVDRFPNVQIFDVADILDTVQKLINNFVLAVSFVGSFVMLSGVLILMGSIALTKSQRIYESAILKALGAPRATLTGTLIAEYALLGALAGAIGASFATLLSYVTCRFLMDIEWTFQPLIIAGGIVATMLVVTVVGVVGSFDVLFRKPLSTLRSQ